MEKAQKVLILSNVTYDLYSMRREVVEAIIDNGYAVSISAILGRKADYFSDLGCKMIDTEIDRRGVSFISDLKLLINYIRIIKQEKPHTVLTYTIKPNLYGGIASTILNVPYLSNITGLGSAENAKKYVKLIVKNLYKIGLRRSSCIFYQNEDGLKKVNKLLKRKDRYQLIPGSGVNAHYFSLQDYPKDDHEVNFLYISRIMKEKGIEEYLEAATIIKKKYPNVNFHVLGFCEEDYNKRLKNLQESNIIIYHGVQNDVREFHKFSHATIHPTYYPEGISNVLLESASCGKPIITTNRSGCREVVEDGVSGYLTEEKNSQDLIDKIESFLSLSYRQKRQMGLEGRRIVEKKFDRQIVVDAYINEINNTLKIPE